MRRAGSVPRMRGMRRAGSVPRRRGVRRAGSASPVSVCTHIY